MTPDRHLRLPLCPCGDRMWVVTESWVSLLGPGNRVPQTRLLPPRHDFPQSWGLHAPRQNRWSWPPLRSPFLGFLSFILCVLVFSSYYQHQPMKSGSIRLFFFFLNFFFYTHSPVVGIWTSTWEWGKGGTCMVMEVIKKL